MGNPNFSSCHQRRDEEISSNGDTCSVDSCLRWELPLAWRDFLLLPISSLSQVFKKNLLNTQTSDKKTTDMDFKHSLFNTKIKIGFTNTLIVK